MTACKNGLSTVVSRQLGPCCWQTMTQRWALSGSGKLPMDALSRLRWATHQRGGGSGNGSESYRPGQVWLQASSAHRWQGGATRSRAQWCQSSRYEKACRLARCHGAASNPSTRSGTTPLPGPRVRLPRCRQLLNNGATSRIFLTKMRRYQRHLTPSAIRRVGGSLKLDIPGLIASEVY